MATAEQHDVVIRWQQQGQAAVQAEANKVKQSFAGIGSSLTKSLSGVSASVKKSLSSVAAQAKQVGTVMSVGVTAPLVAMAKGAIDAASDLNESMSAVKTVFGDAADQVIDFSKTTSTTLAITQTDALNAAISFSGFTRQMGLSQSGAADFSATMVQAAGHLASFYNADPTDMLARLRSGLSGESEPLKQFGFDLSDASVKAKGLALGLTDASGEMTEAGKIQARQALILEQMGPAWGDATRTIGEFAGSQRSLEAQIQELSATFGTYLKPIAADFINLAKDLVGRLQALTPEAQQLAVKIGLVAAAAGPALVVLGQVGPILAALASGPFVLAAGAAVALYKAWESNFLGIRDLVGNVIDRIGGFIGRAVEFFQHAKDRGLDPFRLAFRTMIVTIGEQLGSGNPIVEFLQGIYRNGKKLADWWATDGSTTLATISGFLSKADFGSAAIYIGHLAEDIKGGWDKTIGAWFDDQIAKAQAFPAMVFSPILTGFGQVNWDALKDTLVTKGGELIDSLRHGAQDLWNKTLAPWLHDAIAALPGLFDAAGTWLTTSGADIITGLQHGAQDFWNNSLGPWLRSAADAIPGLFNSAGDWLTTSGVDIITGLLHGMQDFWNNHLAGWVQGAISAFLSLFSAVGSLTIDAGTAIITGLLHGMQDFWNNHLSTWLTAAIAGLPGLFAGAADWLASGGATVISGLLNGLQSYWNNSLSPWLHGVIDGLPGLFAGAADWLVQGGSDLIDGLRHGAQDFWNNTVGPWFSNLGTTISDALPKPDDLKAYLSTQGAALMQGLSDGFFGAFNQFQTDFTDAWNTFLDNLNPLPNATPNTAPPPERHGAGGGSRGTEDPALARAYGGPASGWTWVGERGRELVKLARGSLVIPAGASETRARAMAYGGVATQGHAPILTRDRASSMDAAYGMGAIAIYGNVTINPPNADVAGEISRQFQTRNRS